MSVRDAQLQILDVARDTWTGMTRFFEDMTAERLNWRQLLEQFEKTAGTEGFTAPYGVAVWWQMEDTDEWGFGGVTLRSKCHLWYITSTKGAGGVTKGVAAVRQEIQDAGETLAGALKAISGPDTTVLSTHLDAGPGNVANAYFLDKGIPLAAVAVEAEYLALMG